MKTVININDKENHLLFFCRKIILLLIFVFISDFLIGSLLRYYYFNQQRGSDYLTTYVIDSTRADLVVFGSSRANHHYDPRILEKYLGLSCFNAGRDGNFMFYQYAVLKAVLKRYSPKMVILDIRRQAFVKNNDNYDRLSSLLPYYQNHKEMRSVILLKSRYEKLKLISKIYPFNSLALVIAGGNAVFSKKKREDMLGYIPLRKTWEEPLNNEVIASNTEIDSTIVGIYEAFIRDCVNADIPLFIVCSPYFIKYSEPDNSLIIAKQIAKKFNINFFDFSQDTFYINRPWLFADPQHLNFKGSELFSNNLVRRIKEGKVIE